MKIVFIKACLFNGKNRVIGNITTVTPEIGKSLIDSGKAKSYTGAYPPKGKTKTDFFKPKDI